MLFNKTISTLCACAALGTPFQAQAISVSSYVNVDSPSKNKWDNEFILKQPKYNVPLANAYGVASWYGPGFYGNPTASGETYRPGTMTAAHRYLPMGTRVRVTNLNNGRTAVVRINDRGPYIGGRIIDLGEGAASVLGVKSTGVAQVRLEVLN
jgi:rare lipoprotein A (peptidoglycan hydrolase)